MASFPISRVSSFPGDIKVCAAQMLKLFLPPFECPNRIVASVTNYVVCVCVCVCVSVRERVQSCPTLCDPIDGNPSGSSVRGILQARILEWVAISSSRASSLPRDRTCIFCIGRWVPYHLSHQESVTLCEISHSPKDKYWYDCCESGFLTFVTIHSGNSG